MSIVQKKRFWLVGAILGVNGSLNNAVGGKSSELPTKGGMNVLTQYVKSVRDAAINGSSDKHLLFSGDLGGSSASTVGRRWSLFVDIVLRRTD